jgi:hypothetical protein
MAQFLTQVQDKVLDLVFEVMGESRINRSYEDYMAIAAKLPGLKILHHLVNERLQEKHKAGEMPKFYRKRWPGPVVYDRYPDKISIETLRAALTLSAMRQKRHRWRH